MITARSAMPTSMQLSLYDDAELRRPPSSTATSGATMPAVAGRTFYEFFAGGGMARAGLGPTWQCLFANDFDARKAATYQRNWGEDTLVVADVRDLSVEDLPGNAALVWASFPCQDLSLAGMGAGLRGDRSGTFWPFWSLVEALRQAGRGPDLVVLENVCGTLSSHNGRDFAAIAGALSGAGYRYGAVIGDAAWFLPQSRPRLFIIAASRASVIPSGFVSEGPTPRWHPESLRKAQRGLTGTASDHWVWWRLPAPAKRTSCFADLIEDAPASVPWHSQEETKALLAMMSDGHLQKVHAAQASGVRTVGSVYKRTRLDRSGTKVQRAEVRFDDVAGCLRTPAGGSSRQLILVVDGPKVRSRLISSRETARLMGLADDYRLPHNYNEAYHLTGDGVAVPVVRYLAEHLLEPLVMATNAGRSTDVGTTV